MCHHYYYYCYYYERGLPTNTIVADCMADNASFSCILWIAVEFDQLMLLLISLISLYTCKY